MFQATRRRLALWYAGITALVLVLFASVVYAYVRTTLVERVDDTLNHVVEVVQRSLIIENAPGNLKNTTQVTPRVNLEDSFRQNSETVDDDHIDLEWFDGQGNLVWSTLQQPLEIPLHVNPYGETVRLHSDQLLRQITRRILLGKEVLGYLRVSHPWFEVTAPSQKLMVDLAAGIVVIVGTVAGIGWFLSGLAMEPVQDSYQKLKRFTADASHELRNPIAVIQTNVQVALASPEPDAQFQQTQLQVIERITRRLGKLVDDLLFLARQDSGIVQIDTNLISLGGVLVEVTKEQMAIAADRQISLTFDGFIVHDLMGDGSKGNGIQDNEPQDNHTQDSREVSPQLIDRFDASPLLLVKGDRNQLTRLFTNLISNAIQYTPSGGEVTVSLMASSHQESRVSSKDWAIVRITDSGIGIAESELPYIFDRFYRVDQARSVSRLDDGRKTVPGSTGSGLGLAIAKTIVDAHHGQISVEKPKQTGTTFVVQLPLC